ncbi:MAG: cytochrome c family protein [Gammaproteobacteria bacterium]|nr:cytochrome c family protein [Gammaproteobacteria bacterium]
MNRHKQILIQASSVIEKLVRRKTRLCSVLVLGACCLSGCNGGDTPGSVRSEGDRHAIGTQATGIAINSEGEKLFRLRCGACHSIDPDRPSVIGPHLAGIFGRPAGSVAGFAYSEAMRSYGKKWTPENMDEFLENSGELVPGNRMAFVGLSNAEQRKLIIEYLKIFR